MLAGNLAKNIKGQAFGQQTLANMPQIPVTFAKNIEAIWLGKTAVTTDGTRLDLRVGAWICTDGDSVAVHQGFFEHR